MTIRQGVVCIHLRALAYNLAMDGEARADL
jgi:hypothetical protein